MDLLVPKNIVCGYFDCSIWGDMKQSPQRTRTLYEINYYLEDGKCTYSDGIAYPIKKGYIHIGVPGEICNSLLPFKAKFLKFHAEGDIKARLESATRYFQTTHPPETERMLDEMISLFQSATPDPIMLCGKLMVFLSAVFADSASFPETNGTNNAVIRAKQYMEAHVSEAIRLADIAKHVNLSPNYLHALFHKVTSMTPRDYLTEYRLTLANKYLRTTSLPFSEIAEYCGFCNQQYLSLLFKQKYGKSPSRIRKEAGNDYLL